MELTDILRCPRTGNRLRFCDGDSVVRVDGSDVTYQLVLATTLMHPSIHVAICGIKMPEQVAEAAGAMGKTIDREDYFAIRTALSIGQEAKVADAKGTRK